MAMIRCKECGAEISSSASQCPRCGKKRTSGCSMAVLVVLGIFVSIGILSIAINYCSLKFGTNQRTDKVISETESEPLTPIPYTIIRDIKRSSGGSIKTIVIDPTYANVSDMEKLGETLKYDHKDTRFSEINVFDDKKTAEFLTPEQMNKYAMNLNDHSGDKYYKHFIGQYVVNRNTSFHVFQIYLNGFLNDLTKEIKY
ncbi:MAG: hypothetical protein LHW64_02495 [Candidatus Cloacimonetes bacterium]|jgi:hypothetical protein|nr:hypothetical protein [Candidatus Cloacimonadota bacterium]MCB5286658.1 hypothetical protein [Candidatus Cloacimonadota bacterium]MCK9584040.1 hypothetical protein [Candidatus Cloacimonadota bacterium]MDY0228978.1 hypothetical protein [Candidatus Cloacimonadaceae bacterium]